MAWNLTGNIKGPKGNDGATGQKGQDGSTGPQGAQGVQGPQGIRGEAGPSGPVGPAGANGAVGNTGPAGPQGPVGATGLTGATGPTGTAGATGAAGPAGPAGATGLTGSAGPTGPIGAKGADGVSYTPQAPVSRTVTVATAYQHTDTTKPYKVVVNARSTQTVTVAGLVSDKVELRIGPTAASVAVGGSGGFSVGIWESGITGIALMIGAAVQDGGQVSGDVPAGWYFSVNRLTGTNATIVSCFTQSLTP